MADTLEIGNCRITLVRAGSHWWDGGAMFGVVPKTLWGRHHAADDLNRVEAAFNCFVLEDGSRRILIETGGGIRHDARALDRMNMPAPVHAVDVVAARTALAPEAFDYVINTHLHWDHCSGNTIDRDGVATAAFPNARYIVQRGELAHAREQHPRDAVSYRTPNYEPLIASGHLHLIDGDHDITPEVQVRVAPGHNRDMMVVIIRSAGATWCHFADLAPFAAHLTPTWVAGFDLFPLETIASKNELFGRAAAEGWWCSFGHDPVINFTQIAASKNSFQPIG